MAIKLTLTNIFKPLAMLSTVFLTLSATGLTHVILDPGHGGKDQGATRFGLLESKITLKVALELEKFLKSDPNFKVSLTRRTNRSLRLSQRTQIAIKNKGDIFLSIHVNSSPDPKAHGAEIYFQNQLPPDEESMYLANKENGDKSSPNDPVWPLKPIHLPKGLQPDVVNIIKDLQRNERIRLSGKLSESLSQAWKNRTGFRKRSIRQAPFYVIGHVNMPSALVELGFISHKQEAKRLASARFQKKLAGEIYQGLRHYKEKLDK